MESTSTFVTTSAPYESGWASFALLRVATSTVSIPHPVFPLCDTITARSSATNGEQELGQSTRTWIMHGTSRRQALPKVEAKGAQ